MSWPAPPTDITDHRVAGVLEITWPDGQRSRLPHAQLRNACRCAACEQQRRRGACLQTEDAPLRIVHIAPVGEQGLNIAFSDGHARGIYPWAYLRQLGAA